jgi:transposase
VGGIIRQTSWSLGPLKILLSASSAIKFSQGGLAMKIVAMDLGKNKTVVCIYDQKSGKHKYQTIRTCPQRIHDQIVEQEPERVVFEICSSAGWVYDIADGLGIEIQAANTNGQAWRWKNIRRKNDREDALKLAQLSALGQLRTVHIPNRQVRQKRALIQYRQSLVARSVAIKNGIRAILDKEGLTMAGGKSGWTKESIGQLKSLALPMEECGVDNLWRGSLYIELEMLAKTTELIKQVDDKLNCLAQGDKRVRLLRTIPGVGPRLAEAVVAYVDQPGRFSKGKQVGCYAGLTPRQYQSGDSNRVGKISGQGNKVLRALLVEVCWLGLRHNEWMRRTYQRILRGSNSRKKIAITAVARKLLIRCWAMLRDGTEWRKENKSAFDIAA